MRRPGYPLDQAGAYVFQAFLEGYKFTLSESAEGLHNADYDGKPRAVDQGKETKAHVGAVSFR